MNRKLTSIALIALLAGALGGCQGASSERHAGDGKYADLEQLQLAIESTGINCSSDDEESADISGEGMGKTCNDSYIMYMFDSAQDKQATIDFYAEMQAGILETHVVVGDNWYVVGSKEGEVKKLADKIGGKATTLAEA